MIFADSVTNWVLILLSAFVIGLSKAGLKGVELLNVTFMAIVFGGKASTGVVLPLLCAADIMAVIYYKRHVLWPHFWRLIPWMAAGIIWGVYVGKGLNETYFRRVMAVIIFVTVILMIMMEVRKRVIIPSNKGFVAIMGLISGFTTMLGNLAGPFSNIYFLAMRMSKNDFIGTAAWVFLAMNLFKLPFQIFYWNNINGQTLRTDLWILPALVLGFLAGLKIVTKIKDDNYRKVVIILTLIGAFFIFFRR